MENREAILEFMAFLAQLGVLFAALEEEEKKSEMGTAGSAGDNLDPANDSA